MENLFKILKEKLGYKKMHLDAETLEVFQFPIFDNKEQVDFVFLDADTKHPQHIHDDGNAKLYIISGKGIIYLGNGTKQYSAGQTFVVPKQTAHGFDVEEDTVILSIQDSPILQGEKLDFRYKE
jgi:quercetin dioxygenase-like cupin family protein